MLFASIFTAPLVALYAARPGWGFFAINKKSTGTVCILAISNKKGYLCSYTALKL